MNNMDKDTMKEFIGNKDDDLSFCDFDAAKDRRIKIKMLEEMIKTTPEKLEDVLKGYVAAGIKFLNTYQSEIAISDEQRFQLLHSLEFAIEDLSPHEAYVNATMKMHKSSEMKM